jgi:hypothetical protein
MEIEAAPKADIDESVRFVKRFAWQYGIPIVLQTIHPDKETIRGFTFTDKQEPELRAALKKWDGVENVYFQVNDLKKPLSGASKANKEDVAFARHLQVDIDPSPLEDFDKERVWILKSLQEFKPKPNIIIDSGGGFQGFWTLAEPIEMLPREDGTEPWAEVESRSQQISLQMSADPCFNIDRIMRLPGSVNMPNKKKRAKGRKAALSKVVHWDDGTYILTDFPKAPVVSSIKGGSPSSMGDAREVALKSGNLGRFTPEDIQKLAHSRGQTLNDYTIMLIVQGNDPDAPDRYKSRSEVLFRVLVDMVKAKFEPDEMAAICLDEDYAISAHVKDQKRPMKYIARQIKRATEAVISPDLLRMNERFAIIRNLGGRHLVVTEYYDEAMKRTVLKRQDRDNFMSSFADQQIQTGSTDKGPTFTPLGKWWLYHPDARRYDYLAFVPGQEPEIHFATGNGDVVKKLNLWQGFACEAVPGDCSLYLDHLRDNICTGNLEHYEYLLDWFAQGVQKPDEQGQVCFVMRGPKGAGKSVAAKVYGSLFGRHFIQVANASHLVGNFNAHLRDCICIFADEAFYAGDKKHEAILKTLITEDTLMIEGKGVDVETSPNYIRLIMASNNEWVVPAGSNERRYFVVEVSDRVMQNTVYFKKMMNQLDKEGGREALLHFLLSRDLSNFEIRKIPNSKALNEQKLLSTNMEEQWWMHKLQSGVIFQDVGDWSQEVSKEAMYNDYILESSQARNYKPLTKVGFGKFLSRMTGDREYRQFSYQKWIKRDILNHANNMEEKLTREYFYGIPSLEVCRQLFNLRYGEQDWPVIDQDHKL